MTRSATNRYNKPAFSGDLDELQGDAGRPAAWDQLPWETGEEYLRFRAFLFARPRSVRAAYRLYCEQGGKEPKSNPPSTWFALFRDGPRAVRETNERLAAIEAAESRHGRAVDWEAIEAIVQAAIDEGELERDLFEGPFGEILTLMKRIEVGFLSLEVDRNGNPLPGRLPWVERIEQARGKEHYGQTEDQKAG